VPAAALAVWYVVECRRRAGGIKRVAGPILATGGLALMALVSLVPVDRVGDMQHFYRSTQHFYTAYEVNLRRAFFAAVQWRPQFYVRNDSAWAPSIRTGELWLGYLFLALALIAMWPSAWVGLTILWLAVFYGFFTFVYHGEYWHAGLIPVFLVWTLWLFYEACGPDINKSWWQTSARRALAAGLLLSFGLGDYLGARVQSDLWQTPWSGSKEMARYLEDTYRQRTITSVCCFQGGAVEAYLPAGTRFWIAGEHRIGSYVIWGRFHDRCMDTYNQLMPEIADRATHEQVLVLATDRVRTPPGVTLAPLHSSAGLFESFRLYSVANNDGQLREILTKK